MPLSKTLTMNLDVPEPWLVEPVIAMYGIFPLKIWCSSWLEMFHCVKAFLLVLVSYILLMLTFFSLFRIFPCPVTISTIFCLRTWEIPLRCRRFLRLNLLFSQVSFSKLFLLRWQDIVHVFIDKILAQVIARKRIMKLLVAFSSFWEPKIDRIWLILL